jgi:hypothetical protein
MRDVVGRDGRCRALIIAVIVAGGACGGGGASAPIDAATGGNDGGALDDDANDDPNEDATAADIPAAACPPALGEPANAACNDVVATGPCVAPVMIDSEPPATAGGALVAGTYDLTERILFTYAGGATGPAGEPLAQTIVVSGSGTDWSLNLADLSAATASRQTMAVTLIGSGGQLRATATCPGSGADADAGADAGGPVPMTLYFTAADRMLTLHHFASSGPVRSDTYVMR